jgi:hypothetical protein
MNISLAEPPRSRQSAKILPKKSFNSCGKAYNFAQSGWRAENPGFLNSEAAAQASELFP